MAENHTVIGGLGEAVAAALMRAGVAPEAFARWRCRTSSWMPARCRPARPVWHFGQAMIASIKEWL